MEPEAGRDDLPSFDWVYTTIGRGPLGEHLPEQLVATGKASAKRRTGVGQKGPHTGSTAGC